MMNQSNRAHRNGGMRFFADFRFCFVKSRMLLRGSLSPVGTEVELMWHFILV